MLRQKKTSVLAVPTRLLQKRVTSAPTITVPISSLAQRRESAAVAAAFVPSREQVSRLFGAEWELDVDISWRFLSALLIAPPQQQNDPRAVAALARRCKPLVGDSTSSKPRDGDDGDDDQVETQRHQRDSLRWIKLAPFVHPAAVRAIGGAVPRSGSDMRAFHLMPLMRHGDAAISLSIALASSFPSTAAASPSSSAIPRLRDAEFIASIVEMQGWRENNLIRFSDRQNRDENSTDADSAASRRLPPALAPPEEACVATFVAVIGAVYMQHGVDTAASLATKLAVLAAERDAK